MAMKNEQRCFPFVFKECGFRANDSKSLAVVIERLDRLYTVTYRWTRSRRLSHEDAEDGAMNAVTQAWIDLRGCIGNSEPDWDRLLAELLSEKEIRRRARNAARNCQRAHCEREKHGFLSLDAAEGESKLLALAPWLMSGLPDPTAWQALATALYQLKPEARVLFVAHHILCSLPGSLFSSGNVQRTTSESSIVLYSLQRGIYATMDA
jgi:hypothetical protein